MILLFCFNCMIILFFSNDNRKSRSLQFLYHTFVSLKDFATEPLTGFASVSSCSSVENGDICTAGPYTSPVPPEDTSFSVPETSVLSSDSRGVPDTAIPSFGSCRVSDDPVWSFRPCSIPVPAESAPVPFVIPAAASSSSFVHQEAHIHVFPDTRYNPSSRRFSPFPLQYAELFRL